MEKLLEQLDAEIMSTDFDVALTLPYVERWVRKCKEVTNHKEAKMYNYKYSISRSAWIIYKDNVETGDQFMTEKEASTFCESKN